MYVRMYDSTKSWLFVDADAYARHMRLFDIASDDTEEDADGEEEAADEVEIE